MTPWVSQVAADLVQEGSRSHLGAIHEIKVVGALIFEHTIAENLRENTHMRYEM